MNLPLSFNELSRTFLKNDILSIDIGYANFKVVHVRKRQGNILKILNFRIENTPAGCIKNGIISDIEGIAVNIKKVITEQNMNEKNVKIVISAGSNILSKVIFIPKIDARKVEERIRAEISNQVSVELQTHKLFYRVIEGPFDSIDYIKVLVTVVPNSIVDNYIKLINILNFKPVSIEIPFSSVARFFNAGVRICTKEERFYKYFEREYIDLDKRPTAVADLGSETTNLSILNNGALEFNRIILTGGRHLDEIIAGRLVIKRESAEQYKRMHGIVDKLHLGDEIERIVDESVREYFVELLTTIKRSLEFYVNRCGGQRIERLLFIGGGSGLKGLKKFSEEILGIPVYTVDLMEFGNIEFEDNLSKSKVRFLVNALGIAI